MKLVPLIVCSVLFISCNDLPTGTFVQLTQPKKLIKIDKESDNYKLSYIEPSLLNGKHEAHTFLLSKKEDNKYSANVQGLLSASEMIVLKKDSNIDLYLNGKLENYVKIDESKSPSKDDVLSAVKETLLGDFNTKSGKFNKNSLHEMYNVDFEYNDLGQDFLSDIEVVKFETDEYTGNAVLSAKINFPKAKFSGFALKCTSDNFFWCSSAINDKAIPVGNLDESSIKVEIEVSFGKFFREALASKNLTLSISKVEDGRKTYLENEYKKLLAITLNELFLKTQKNPKLANGVNARSLYIEKEYTF